MAKSSVIEDIFCGDVESLIDRSVCASGEQQKE